MDLCKYLPQLLKVGVPTDVLVKVVPVIVLHSGVMEYRRHRLEPCPQCGVRGQTTQLVAVGHRIGRMVTPVRLRIIN